MTPRTDPTEPRTAPHHPDVLRCRNCAMPWSDHAEAAQGAAPLDKIEQDFQRFLHPKKAVPRAEGLDETYPTPVTDQREMAGWMRRENDAYMQGRIDAANEILTGLGGVRRHGGMVATADVEETINEAKHDGWRCEYPSKGEKPCDYTHRTGAVPRAEGLDAALADILRWTKPGSLYADGTNGYSPAGPEKVARIHNRARAAFGDAPLPPSRPSDERQQEER